MAISFKDKVVIITGAGGGLGRAHALEFAALGAKVVINDLGGSLDGTGGNSAAAEKVVEEIKAKGGEAIANGASVSDDAGVAHLVKQTMDTWGRIDVLIANAGILRGKSFGTMELQDFTAVMDVPLMGTVKTCKAVWDIMKAQGYGRIVVTPSSTGLYGNFGQTNYGAAKGGIWGLSNVLAIEGRKYNIRIWTLAPGALTRMTADLPRYKENPGAALGPDGIAPAVLYMVSDLSGDQTGKVLGVSGPRGVREMRMMEMEGWTPPFAGWKAEDIVTHAKEIFFSEEDIKKSARRFK